MSEALVDANVLVRFLTGEPAEMAERANAILERGSRGELTLTLTPLVVAELVYVLHRVYGWPRALVAERLLELVATDAMQVLEAPVVEQALTWYRDVASVHFPEAYLAALALLRGHGRVASFDRDVHRLPGVLVLDR